MSVAFILSGLSTMKTSGRSQQLIMTAYAYQRHPVNAVQLQAKLMEQV
jgi:hypothetical protein